MSKDSINIIEAYNSDKLITLYYLNLIDFSHFVNITEFALN